MKEHPLALELQKLRVSSKNAVAHGASYSLDKFNEYLHIEREVEKKLRSQIEYCAEKSQAQLLMVCGNVGDGKSHILSYLNKDLKDIISLFKIHNDATESHNPNEKSNQTLFKLLEGFQDDRIAMCRDKIILAINLGTLNNFLEEYGDKFKKLVAYVEQQKILDNELGNDDQSFNENFKHVNFTDYHMYSLTKDGPRSNIISTLLERIVKDDSKNQIYKAYTESKTFALENCPICKNYEFLFDENNRATITDLIIQAIVKNKLIISVRGLLNFFFDIIVPIGFKWENIDRYKEQVLKLKPSELLNSFIPNYLFEHPELSVVFDKMSKLDPCSLRYFELDLELIRLINSDSPDKIFEEFISSEKVECISGQLKGLLEEKVSSKIKNDSLTKSFIRLNYFNNRLRIMTNSDTYYLDYMDTLYHFNNNKSLAIEKIYVLVQEAARKWNGNPNKKGKVVLKLGKKQSKYRVFKSFKAVPSIEQTEEHAKDKLVKFVKEFSLKFKVDGEDQPSKIHVDYGLFKILNQINKGYLPNRKDNNNYLSFVSLIRRLINQDGEADLEIDAINKGKASDYKLSRDDFGNYKFETL